MAATASTSPISNGAPGAPFGVATSASRQSVTRRLQSELMQLMMSAPSGVSAFPVSDDNLLAWAGTIEGPDDTYYAGMKFKISLEFPQEYPYKPPNVKFTSPMYHPNIDMGGNICLDILQNTWSAALNVQTVLLSLQSLLGEPNNKSPLNGEAASLWDFPEKYRVRLDQRCKRED